MRRRLTPDDELELLTRIADGMTGAEIAVECGLTTAMVSSRLQKMRARFGANTSAHLIALAYHQGVLVAPTRRRAA